MKGQGAEKGNSLIPVLSGFMNSGRRLAEKDESPESSLFL
jgi:hypothetical protein